jgi:hypothetical protein
MFTNYKKYETKEEAELCFCIAIGAECFEINSIPGGTIASKLSFTNSYFQVSYFDGDEVVTVSEMAAEPGKYYIRSCTKRPISL